MPLTRSLFSDKGTGSLQMAKEPPHGIAVRGLSEAFSYSAWIFLSFAKRGRESTLGSLGSPWIRGRT